MDDAIEVGALTHDITVVAVNTDTGVVHHRAVWEHEGNPLGFVAEASAELIREAGRGALFITYTVD